MSKSDRERLPVYFEYVKRFEAENSDGKKKNLWIPRRCAQEDWVLSVWVYRFSKTQFEVALFLAADCLLFVKDGGVIAAIMYCLSDAYLYTGKMELHFRGSAANPTFETGYEPVVPESIVRVAHNSGVSIKKGSRVISDSQGRELYVKITEFSLAALELLKEKNIDPVHVSFLVNRGVWTREQIELFSRHSCNPQRLLGSEGISPKPFLLYQRELLLLRFGLMAERFKTTLETSGDAENCVVEAKWLGINKQAYSISTSLDITTVFGEHLTIPKNTSFHVVHIPRDMDEYNFFAESDFSISSSGVMTLLTVTKDFDWVSRRTRDVVRQPAASSVVGILDTLGELDEEIQQRLARSGSTQRPLAEQPE